MPEGLNSLQGEEVWGYNFFDRVYVNGRRQRLGLQFDWSPGPLGFKAEWMQSREERLGQSNRNEDLSDFIGTAWYTSATWIVTGEDKDSDVHAERPVVRRRHRRGRDRRALRPADLRERQQEGPDFTNPRSDHLTPNTDSTLTFGVNWMPIRWVKVVANALRQTFDDVNRAPIVGHGRLLVRPAQVAGRVLTQTGCECEILATRGGGRAGGARQRAGDGADAG